MKNIFRFIVIIVVIIIVGILSISYIDNHNQNTLNQITKTIQENYSVEEEITYSNQYGNYYIFTTPNYVVVLTKEFSEVLKENISLLAPNNDNYDLIYKTNQLMYEETVRDENKLTYIYYDAKTNKQIKETTLEQQ